MKFINEAEKTKMAIQLGLPISMTEKEVADAFMAQKSTYINEVKDWRRSNRQKMNWMKYRSIYQIGINRYHRNGKDLVNGGIVDRIKKAVGIKESWGLLDLNLELHEMEGQILKQLLVIDLEETMVESQLFLELAMRCLFEARKNLTEGIPLTEEHLEVLTILSESP